MFGWFRKKTSYLKNEPIGFRGIIWRDSPSQHPELVLVKEEDVLGNIPYGRESTYVHSRNLTKFGAADVLHENYSFCDEGFYSMLVSAYSTKENVEALIAACTMEWGAPSKGANILGQSTHDWEWEKIKATLALDPVDGKTIVLVIMNKDIIDSKMRKHWQLEIKQ